MERSEQNGHTLAAVVAGDGTLCLKDRPLSVLCGTDVLIRISHVGICGSDIKYWLHGECGRFKMTHPMVIGHEASGIVTQRGSDVRNLRIGDRVAIEPGVSCRKCDLCRQGNYNLCLDMRFCATPPVDGNLCQFFVHPADLCHRLPDNVPLELGALVEPLSVAVYACKKGQVQLGSKVCIFGAGPVGLLCLLVAQSLGADDVTLVDIEDKRLAFARDLQATKVVNVSGMSTEEITRTLHEHSLPDVSMECSGVDSSLAAALNVTTPGGRVVNIGRASKQPSLNLSQVVARELTITGVFRYANCYPPAISLLHTYDKIMASVKKLITHRFNMAQAQKAFETAANVKNSGAVKVVINC